MSQLLYELKPLKVKLIVFGFLYQNKTPEMPIPVTGWILSIIFYNQQ